MAAGKGEGDKSKLPPPPSPHVLLPLLAARQKQRWVRIGAIWVIRGEKKKKLRSNFGGKLGGRGRGEVYFAFGHCIQEGVRLG